MAIRLLNSKIAQQYTVLAVYIVLVVLNTIFMLRDFNSRGEISPFFMTTSVIVIGLSWVGMKIVDRIAKRN